MYKLLEKALSEIRESAQFFIQDLHIFIYVPASDLIWSVFITTAQMSWFCKRFSPLKKITVSYTDVSVVAVATFHCFSIPFAESVKG